MQRCHQLAADIHRINRHMRHRGMRATAFNLDFKFISCCHNRAGPNAELANRHAGQIMHAIDFRDAKAIHQPILHHRFAATTAFFRRLENHDGRARKIPRLGEIFGCPQQHGGVPVMAARVHFAGNR